MFQCYLEREMLANVGPVATPTTSPTPHHGDFATPTIAPAASNRHVFTGHPTVEQA
jgi:hypothetical protein